MTLLELLLVELELELDELNWLLLGVELLDDSLATDWLLCDVAELAVD